MTVYKRVPEDMQEDLCDHSQLCAMPAKPAVSSILVTGISKLQDEAMLIHDMEKEIKRLKIVHRIRWQLRKLEAHNGGELIESDTTIGAILG